MRNKCNCTIWGVVVFCISLVTGCGGGGGGGDTITVIREPRLAISSTSHDFAGVVINNDADQTFTITNVGNNPGLNINSISTPPAPFSIINDNCTGASLAINASCTFTARFSPTAQSPSPQVPFSGISAVFSNDSNSPAVVNLAGTGYGLNVWISGVAATACTEDVRVGVGVTNSAGFLGGLLSGDFALTQNGVPQSITGFQFVDPDSVSAALALDLSSSVGAAIPDIKLASTFFVNQLRAVDEAAIFKFKAAVASYPSSPPSFVTTDAAGKTELINLGINSADPAADGTALYNAVHAAVTRAAAGTKSKKAVIVLSDGANQVTTGNTLAEVIGLAKTAGVPIFTIHYVDPAHASTAKPEILKQMADETGGQDFYADRDTMQNIYGQISALLSQGYTISYRPTACPAPATSLTVRADSIDGLYGLGTRVVDLP